MQLQIKPGLCQAWRGPQTVQIGLDARRGTVVDGLTSSDRRLLAQLTAGLDDDARDGQGARVWFGDERARELVRLLSDAGVLVRSRAGRAALSRLGAQRHRLAADAEVWSVVHEGVGDGWELLAARAGREVEVVGAGRTGSSLATMLAAAGVGRVRVRDPGPVRPQDVAPAGAGASDVGRPREEAVRLALHRLGHRPRRSGPHDPGPDDSRPHDPVLPGGEPAGTDGTDRAGSPAVRSRPDFVVRVEQVVADAAAADLLLAADIPHLSVVVGEVGATVGPLVVPGRGPCLRCLELHRADRDPGWPQLLAQLLSARRGASAEETTCASLTAALACLQVLCHLDGLRAPAALAATLEIELPEGLISRRDWPAHPACGCHWPPSRPSAGPCLHPSVPTAPRG
jgi:hypothetical protein